MFFFVRMKDVALHDCELSCESLRVGRSLGISAQLHLPGVEICDAFVQGASAR